MANDYDLLLEDAPVKPSASPYDALLSDSAPAPQAEASPYDSLLEEPAANVPAKTPSAIPGETISAAPTFLGEVREGNLIKAAGMAHEAIRRQFSGLMGPTEAERIEGAIPFGKTPQGETIFEYKPLGDRMQREAALFTPYLKQEQMAPEADDSPITAIGKSVFNVASGVLGAIESPAGAMLPMSVSGTASKVVAGGFGLDMLTSVKGQIEDALNAETTQGKIEGWLGAVVSLAMAGAATKHAFSGKPLPIDIEKNVEVVPDTLLQIAAADSGFQTSSPKLHKAVVGEMKVRGLEPVSAEAVAAELAKKDPVGAAASGKPPETIQATVDAELNKILSESPEKTAADTSVPPPLPPAAGKSEGPGAAAATEFPEQQSTGLKRAVVDTERLSRDAEPIPTVERQREEGVVQAAENRVDADPTVASSLVSRIVDAGDKAISEHDAAVLLVERNRVMNERRQWEEKLANGEDVELAQAELAKIEPQLERLDQAQRAAGTTWGRLGHMYQRMILEDFTLEAMERKARAAVKGPLNEAQRTKVKDLYETIDKLRKEAGEAKTVQEQVDLNEQVARTHEATIKQLETELSARPKFGKEVFEIAQGVVDRWKADAVLAHQSLRERLGRTSAGVDPTILVDVARIMRARIGEAGLDFAKASTELIADFGEAVRPYIDQAWKKAQQMIAAENAPAKVKEAVTKGALKKEKTPADIKAKAKAEAVAGEELSQKTVGEYVRALLGEGVRGTDNLMKAAHEGLKEFFPDATERDIRRAYVEYGKMTFPSKEEIPTLERKLKQVVKIQEDIDRITKDNLDPLRKGYQRDKADQEIRDLTKQRNDLLKTIEGPPSPERLATRQEAKQTALRNAIEDADRELKTGIKKLREAGLPDDPTTERLRAELGAMREKLREIDSPPKTEAEVQIEQLGRIKERLEKTLSGEIDPKTGKPFVALTDMAADMQAEIQALQELAAQMRRDAKPKTDPGAAEEARRIKILDNAIERYRANTETLAKGGVVQPKGKPQGPDSREVAARKQILNSRRATYEALKKAGKPVRSPEQIYNERRIVSIQKRLQELKDRRAAGIFTRPKKPLPTKAPATLKAEGKLLAAEQEFKAWVQEQQRKMQPWYKKAVGLLGEVRGIILGSDIGVLTRQGLFSWSRPTTAISSTYSALKSALSPEAMNRWEVEVRDRIINGAPAEPVRKAAGLQTTDRLTHPEELAITRLLSRLPDIKIAGRTVKLSALGKTFERFQTTFINAVRIDLFDAAVKRGWTPTELQLRANFINSATGRSNVKYVPKIMSAIFTSPRYEVSRWEMLAQPIRNVGALTAGGAKGTINKAALANIQDMAVTIAGVYGIFKTAEHAGGYSVNWNPLSADFLKMRKGDEVWDVSAGLAPRLRDLLRLYVAFTHPDYKQNIGKVLTAMGLRTINPAITTAIEQSSIALQRARGSSKPIAPLRGFRSDEDREGLIAVAPLIVQATNEALKEDGAAAAAFTAAREFVGSSVNRYPASK